MFARKRILDLDGLEGFPCGGCHPVRLPEACPALLHFPPPRSSFSLDRRPDAALDYRMIDLWCRVCALQAFNFPLQFGDPASRLIETSDLLLRLL